MNIRLLANLLGKILMIEAGSMAFSMAVSLCYRDGDFTAFLMSIGIILLVSLPLWYFSKPKNTNLRAREGIVVVGAAWLLMSLFGCLPFMFSGLIPNFFNAFFECVSGFTTTGASVLTNFPMTEYRGVFFWRSFTHWIGGMGVLVLTIAILPGFSGRTSHLMRAESPGPSLAKLVPRMGNTAKLMYVIYTSLTALLIALLLCSGMNLYDATIHAFGTAGTGGFSNYSASVGAFNNPLIEGIITLFMLAFGVNFAIYYKIFKGSLKEALCSEELRVYLIIAGVSTLLMTLNILPVYGNFFTALRYGGFHMASIMSTTGFITSDFHLWPQFSRVILVMLMFIGSCAGSTGGGIKVIRAISLSKTAHRQALMAFQPHKVKVVHVEGKAVDEIFIGQVLVFFFAYFALLMFGTLIISLDNLYDFETNFTAALSCISNVGPGLGAVGPVGNYAGYSGLSKLILSVIMLAGRLELFPIFVLFHIKVWKRQ